METKILYDELCKFKFFDYFSMNYKTHNYDKVTKWKFYDKNDNFNILSFVQTNMAIHKKNILQAIDRKWYIGLESNNFKYTQIDYNGINELKEYLQQMTENYENNISYLNEINNIIGKTTSKDYKNTSWNLRNIKHKKTTFEYISVSFCLFKENFKNKNIKIIKKNKNKNETVEFIDITDFLKFIKNISFETTENDKTQSTEEIEPKICKDKKDYINYEIRPRNEISNTYKNLFIKKKLMDRLSIQSGKTKNELQEKLV